MERIYNSVIKFNGIKKKVLYSFAGLAFLALSIGLFTAGNELPEKVRGFIFSYISEVLLSIF